MNAPMSANEVSAAALAKNIQNEITRSVQDSISKGMSLLRVRGRLGTLRYGYVTRLFGVKLVGGGDEVQVDIPKAILVKLRVTGRKAAVLTGVLIGVCNRYTGHRMEFHWDVAETALAEQSQLCTADRQQQMPFARLNGLTVQRRHCPAELPWVLSLVSSKSGQTQVDQDFLLKLQAVSVLAMIEKISVNLLSAQDMADGIAKANEHVVAPIRGGGNADQFAVFDIAAVLEALAKTDVHRVIALGHTANTTLLDLVAAYAATPPTRAGAHICRLIEHTTLPLMEVRRLPSKAHHAQTLVLEYRATIGVLQSWLKRRVPFLTVAAIAAAAMAAGAVLAKLLIA